ncbi:uncharacterized protein LOC126903127 [Daktulosphaira vitifoliae]|uniref:uncharacterized protein LOC126903127 n=1 Tax=Daktulosphaira vitifoliae TaxID=58002 RepID=UPI0021AABA9D|nr:uncharacterized protein LOC126903127 [Daktulosphaira vitifoliae]
MTDSDTTSGEENETLKIGKKRKVYPQTWKRQKIKIVRQNGTSYTSVSGLIETKPVIRRRQRSEIGGANAKLRASNFAYFVNKNELRISVCKQAFMSLHAMSHIQVQRLTSILLSGISPKDGRGKHKNRPSKIKDEFIVKMKEPGT